MTYLVRQGLHLAAPTATRDAAPARAAPSRVAGLSIATEADPQNAGTSAWPGTMGGLDKLDHR